MGSKLRVTVGILLVSTVVFSNDCQPSYAKLTDSQVGALKQAKATHSIELLEGEVNGKKRTVVILGEIHTQTRQGRDNARAVVNQFPVRGVEGYPGSALWKGYRSLAYFVHGLFTGKLGGSTITYSKLQHEFFPKVRGIVEKYKLKDKTPEELERFRHRHRGVVFKGTDLVEMDRVASSAQNFSLESDYRPTGADKRAAWLIPSVYLADRLWFAPGVAALEPLVRGDLTTATVLGSTSLATLFGTTMMKIHMSESEVSPGMTKRRDQAMADSVRQHLASHPETGVVLLVVGKGHVYGVRENLKKEGFEWNFDPLK